MGSIAGGRLAGAVSEAGGLGLIGGGYGEKAWLDREFAAAGNRPVGCGFNTWAPAKQPGLLDHVLARGPATLMLSFGDPRPFAKRIQAEAAVLICQVQSRDHAVQALDANTGRVSEIEARSAPIVDNGCFFWGDLITCRAPSPVQRFYKVSPDRRSFRTAPIGPVITKIHPTERGIPMPQIETKNETVQKLAGLHLYHDPLSSCAMRVRMVLAEKTAMAKPRHRPRKDGARDSGVSINQSQRARPDAHP